mmetsp:Transcript_13513/g.26940  ORF Transcript_13513/g.26940 Transcript_13513/m.26940 type:complete len:90 (-) Transcript_13513:169-438(-)
MSPSAVAPMFFDLWILTCVDSLQGTGIFDRPEFDLFFFSLVLDTVQAFEPDVSRLLHRWIQHHAGDFIESHQMYDTPIPVEESDRGSAT